MHIVIYFDFYIVINFTQIMKLSHGCNCSWYAGGKTVTMDIKCTAYFLVPIYIYIYIAYKDKNSGPATGTRGIAVTASALEKPETWVRLPASVRFFICSVASFLICCLCEGLEGPIS